MSKLNLTLFLNAYSDGNPSNNPNRSNFKWERSLNGLLVNDPNSLEFSLAPGESKTLLNGSRVLTQDLTTQYSIVTVPSSSASYQLKWVGGTSPGFRASRSTGADATTGISVTVNGPVATFTSTAGTSLNLIAGGVVVGDFVRIGNLFNSLNRGEWKIIAVTATSFSVVNVSAAAEGPIVLGAGFGDQLKIYGADGVQVSDTLRISGGFSPITQGSYIVTSVSDTFLQFSSVSPLPQEGPITTQSVAVYYMAKNLIYIESDQNISILTNGSLNEEISPIVVQGTANNTKPGMFLKTSTVHSLTITNNSVSIANIFFASVE